MLVSTIQLVYLDDKLTGPKAGSVILICIAVPWLALTLPFLGVIYWLLQSFYLVSTMGECRGMTNESRLLGNFASTTRAGDELESPADKHIPDNVQVCLFRMFCGPSLTDH